MTDSMLTRRAWRALRIPTQKSRIPVSPDSHPRSRAVTAGLAANQRRGYHTALATMAALATVLAPAAHAEDGIEESGPVVASLQPGDFPAPAGLPLTPMATTTSRQRKGDSCDRPFSVQIVDDYSPSGDLRYIAAARRLIADDDLSRERFAWHTLQHTKICKVTIEGWLPGSKKTTFTPTVARRDSGYIDEPKEDPELPNPERTHIGRVLITARRTQKTRPSRSESRPPAGQPGSSCTRPWRITLDPFTHLVLGDTDYIRLSMRYGRDSVQMKWNARPAGLVRICKAVREGPFGATVADTSPESGTWTFQAPPTIGIRRLEITARYRRS